MSTGKKIKALFLVSALGMASMNVQGQPATHAGELLKERVDNSAPTKAAVEEIIRSFVEDYKTDRHATEKRVVGIQVPEVDAAWTIRVTGKEIGHKKWEVLLEEGLPDIPTYAYRAEVEALEAINSGEMNALTAQAKAFSTDYAPLEVKEINGYTPTEDDDGKLNAFSFHFWTKGFPEVIPFRPSATRRAHGGSATIFYYEKGLRTGWFSVLPGDRVREDAREQAMPFPMMGGSH